MKKILALFSIILVSVFSGLIFGVAFDINPIIPASVSFVVSAVVPLPSGCLYSLLFAAPGGIATPFAFNFHGLPQFLTWNNVVPLTSLRIETQEDGVLHDLVAASIAVVNGYMVVGALPANVVVLRVGNGFLKNKNVTISGVTSAAGAVDFFGASDSLGTHAYKTMNANILALEPTVFSDFTAIWTPTMAAVTDTCYVEYRFGHNQLYNINDMTAISSIYQDVPQIMLNNINANIHRATYQCAGATPAYILKVAL